MRCSAAMCLRRGDRHRHLAQLVARRPAGRAGPCGRHRAVHRAGPADRRLHQPFFTFFMFLLLSAAIRWGWHLTAATAILLALLYLIVGMLVATLERAVRAAAVRRPRPAR